MTKPQGTMRPLFYPLNRNADIESQTPNETVNYIDLSEWPTTDNDERIEIVLSLSLDEYVALADSIDVGRDIAYGENSLEIWWIWVRSLMSLSICQSIIDCIENDSDVLTAIQDAVKGLPDGLPRESQYNQTAFDISGTCDNDQVYGYCLALWTYINANNVDFLQQMAEATNLAGQIKKLIGLIPGASLLPSDSVLEWISNFGDYNLEAYNASITVGVQQEIVCDLFCLALENNCSLEYGIVWQYFADRIGSGVPALASTFGEWVIFMVTGAYPSDKIVYIWSALQMTLAFIGQEFLGISSVEPYALQAQSGNPDSDWDLFCDECVWTSFVDFTVDDYGFVFIPFDDSSPEGAWIEGIGLVAQDGVGGSRLRRILQGNLPFDESTIVSINIQGSYTRGTSTGGFSTAIVERLRLDGTPIASTTLTKPFTDFSVGFATPFDLTKDGFEEQATQFDVALACSYDNYSGGAVLQSMTIRGIGDKPPQLP